jgi:hypothetical protein
MKKLLDFYPYWELFIFGSGAILPEPLRGN